MANDFYNAGGVPAQGSGLTSPNMRAEFAAVQDGFNKLPGLTGNAYKIVYVNASGSALDVIGGNGLLKLSTAGIPTVAVAGTDYQAPLTSGTDYLAPGYVHAATAKATPDDADEVGIQDSASSFAQKKTTIAGIKAFFKTYFDGVYTTVSAIALRLVSQSDTAYTAGGTTGAFTLTPAPALAAYSLFSRYQVKFPAAGNGSDTINISGLGTKSLKQYDSSGAKVSPVIASGQLADVEYDGTDFVILDPLPSSAASDPTLFYKADPTSPAFTKTAAGTVSVKAGTGVVVAGVKLSWSADTAITMPTLNGGTDYAIYACTDGSIRADANMSAPSGYTTGNSRKIGGFHYGLVAAGTTVAGGSFNTAGSPVGGGMVWTQTDVDNIAGINKFSLWDLKFRPVAADPRGMVLVNGRTWVDIYLCNTDTAANGTSKAGSNIASGTVLPKVPAAFGGNGTLTYSTLTWWEANELARANQKRLLLASEFYDAAFGVTENQSIDATASTYPTTQRNAGYTSKYGIEQASGHHWTWGMDSAGSASAYVANGGRGQSYNNSVYRVILGGARASGANSGSRCSYWYVVTSDSNWNLGLRAACDHLQLA